MSIARMRVAGAPVSFGVDEIMVDDAWMPAADDVLDWLVDIGVEGTERVAGKTSARDVFAAARQATTA